MIIKMIKRMAGTALLASAVLFASCSNLFENINDAKTEIAGGQARITLSLGLEALEEGSSSETDARTVMAKASDNSVNKLTEISLYKKLSGDAFTLGSKDTLLVSWKTYDEFKVSPYSETLEAGVYDFMLTAKSYGTTMGQTLTGKKLYAGSSTALNFTALTASGSGDKKGGIELSLSYGSSLLSENFKKFVTGYTSPYPSISISLDSKVIATKDSSTYSLSETSDTEGNTYSISSSRAEFVSAPVSEGFHIVAITFTATDASVFVSPIPVYVQAGYLSKATVYPLDLSSTIQNGSAESYKVTYNSNTETAKTLEQTFYKGSSLADAEALGFESGSTKRFKGWNTAADGSGTSYQPNESPALEADITLYAQWADFKKVTYLINLDELKSEKPRTDVYIQKYETGDALVTAKEAFPKQGFQYWSQTGYSKSSASPTFCGWDTKADGSGIRYDSGDKPEFTEDTVLYAQWCGQLDSKNLNNFGNKKYYEVMSLAHWNALMGSSLVNQTEGTITANIYIYIPSKNSSTVLEGLVERFTSSKTFSGTLVAWGNEKLSLTAPLFAEVAEDSLIYGLRLNAPVCGVNKGTIENVAVRNFSITGTKESETDEGYAGAICKKNEGTIDDCIVEKVTVDGNANGLMYTGGLCGYNSGTIKGTCEVSGTVKGKASGKSYTGGFTGYNAGTIESTNSSVDITLSGSDDDEGCYGYVIGDQDSASGVSTSTDITTNAGESETKTLSFSGDVGYKVTVSRTSNITLEVTDNAGGAALDAAISKSSSWSTSNAIKYVGNVSGEKKTIKSGYLNKGTYYILFHENNILNDGAGSATWTIE